MLVPPGDAITVADAIQRLASDVRLRKQLSVNARSKVVNKFNTAENIHTLAALLKAQLGSDDPVSITVE